MTVAAVLHFQVPAEAVIDAAGRPAVRRMVESAWAGGATPIIVVADDPQGRLAEALAGSPAVLAQAAPATEDQAAQFSRGVGLALERVSETDAVLLWPGSMIWVDAESVTSLIEAHGRQRTAPLRPAYHGQPGWPLLLPLARAETLAETLSEWTASESLETGDPGVIHDRTTSLDALPDFEGPPQPAGGPPPDWGPMAAEASDDSPLEGPALAPYGQATAEET